MPASDVKCDACQGLIKVITVRELYGKDYPAGNQRVKDIIVDAVFKCTSCGKVHGVTSTMMSERHG